jgi:serine protease AprX
MSLRLLLSSGCRVATVTVVAVLAFVAPALAGPRSADSALDAVLRARARQLSGTSRVIVQFRDRADVRAITGRGGVAGKKLSILKAHVAEIHNSRLASLATDPRVDRVYLDHPAFATMERTGGAIGAALAREELGLTGAGVGVAVIDSGVSAFHDDLYMERDGVVDVYAPRVVHFRDFLNPWVGDNPEELAGSAYDDYGHGTHVAGIIAGNGYDSQGGRTGVAPKADIIGLKVLDANGAGYVSDVIAAIDYAVSVKATYNIRVINLSAGTGVYESYNTDPLAQAAKRAVDAGIVVVAAAGNLGRNAEGNRQFGGITSPGNAPWVLTVGATSHQGTTERSDDVISAFSSSGPSWRDFNAKPDLVAPGVGIESLSEPYSTLSEKYATYTLSGSDPWLWYAPYLSLSGTSMATPVVAGTVALMLEANPGLTPNAVKAILQYTAQVLPSENFLTQGSGYLNARGAVRMARFFAHPEQGLGERADLLAGELTPWSQHLIWGNHRIGGGVLLPNTNAWTLGLTWGAKATATGGQVVWGTESLDNIVWSMDANGRAVWGYNAGDNIVWSMDENIVWSMDDNIVWSMDDNIVWSMDDNIVWSMTNAENIVWGMDCGGANCPSVVWGANAGDGTLWGTAAFGDNIVWSMDDNIVWSMDDDNIVWSMASNIVWSMSAPEPVLWPSTSSSDSLLGSR